MSGLTALISGVCGQDGTALAAFLLRKGYRVYGLARWEPEAAEARLPSYLLQHDCFSFLSGDVTDGLFLARLIDRLAPDEIYNLAAMSHVAESFETPMATAQINGLGVLNWLEALRLHDAGAAVRFYQASSSELFGDAPAPQSEATPFRPCSPYATAKLFAYWSVVNYREAYGLFASNGILFNHESPARSPDFVTSKIVQGAIRVLSGRGAEPLRLGNLDACRDWGHAADYVRGMWMILRHDRADDFVLGTGRTHSVRAFAEAVFAELGVRLLWQGEGAREIARDAVSGRVLIAVDPALFRPVDVPCLQADAAKAAAQLGWRPEKTFSDLVRDMVRAAQVSAEGGQECVSNVYVQAA